ncbi:hypothetical protein DPMN_116027 [Dreissena polymorpha]|uniref:Uncharacterized protein n=1 Tax=Dreissena polymorpha TaxID=45954 RepID=A0A9D4KMY7_DREPO|nr:hypothetical protein DPMN_116027 [Dreissena polymorpha]
MRGQGTQIYTKLFNSESSYGILPRWKKLFETVDLRNNDIQAVPDKAFGDLPKLYNVDLFGIILFNNSISFVNDSAFLGLENTRVVVDLGDNYLTTIPQALRILRHIEV